MYKGYVMDLINKLKEDLFFEVEFYLVEDGNYGGQDSNGKWNGMVGDLVNDVSGA